MERAPSGPALERTFHGLAREAQWIIRYEQPLKQLSQPYRYSLAFIPSASRGLVHRPETLHACHRTGHWFVEPDRSQAYDRAAASLARDRTVAFLKCSSTVSVQPMRRCPATACGELASLVPTRGRV